MNRVMFVVLAISVVLASGLIGSRPAQEEVFVPGELVVFFVDDGQPALNISASAASAASPSVDRVLARHGLASAKALFGPHSRLRNAYLLRFPQEARIDAIISALERLTQVRSVSKNWILRPDFTPDDYYFNHDYNCDGRLARCQPGGTPRQKNARIFRLSEIIGESDPKSLDASVTHDYTPKCAHPGRRRARPLPPRIADIAPPPRLARSSAPVAQPEVTE